MQPNSPMTADSAELLTIGSAATLLGVSPDTLRNWDRAGKLRARRHPINQYRLYDRDELKALRLAIEGKPKG